jgi:hypothetical protein
MDGTENQPLESCPRCGCKDIFIRKDFPQKLGMAIVVLAAVLFLILAARPTTFYLGAWLLVAAVVVDAVFYLFVPKVMTCYRCRTDFRGVPINPAFGKFELATAEKYRGQPDERN